MTSIDTCRLMNEVYATSFALDDLNLYLNTHPDDREAAELFQRWKKAEKDAEEAYTRATGRQFRVTDEDCQRGWGWIDGPWPWEGEY